jgi:hypothetical protein
MKWIKTFESVSEIEKLCEYYGIKNWSINSEGLVDVNGNVYLKKWDLGKIPIKFGRVSGYFNCSSSRLKSLEGSPRWVGDYFECVGNDLETLNGGPVEVGGNFHCHTNKLSTLEGSPIRVGGNFRCEFNKLWTFSGAPEFIGGEFFCHNNKILEIWELFRTPKYIDWFNDHDVIRMDENAEPCVVLNRLNAFLEDIGRKPVSELKNYKTI